MSDAAFKTTRDRALDVVRGCTDHDAVAVRDALASDNAGGWTEVYADFAVAGASRAWARGEGPEQGSAMLLNQVWRQGAESAAPWRMRCGSGVSTWTGPCSAATCIILHGRNLLREVLGEERLELVPRNEVHAVVEVDVSGALHDMELLRLASPGEGVLGGVGGVGVLPSLGACAAGQHAGRAYGGWLRRPGPARGDRISTYGFP